MNDFLSFQQRLFFFKSRDLGSSQFQQMHLSFKSSNTKQIQSLFIN